MHKKDGIVDGNCWKLFPTQPLAKKTTAHAREENNHNNKKSAAQKGNLKFLALEILTNKGKFAFGFALDTEETKRHRRRHDNKIQKKKNFSDPLKRSDYFDCICLPVCSSTGATECKYDIYKVIQFDSRTMIRWIVLDVCVCWYFVMSPIVLGARARACLSLPQKWSQQILTSMHISIINIIIIVIVGVFDWWWKAVSHPTTNNTLCTGESSSDGRPVCTLPQSIVCIRRLLIKLCVG